MTGPRAFPLLGVLVAVAPFGGVALADEPPPFDWSGVYAGFDGGGAAGDLVTTDASLTTAGTLFGITPTTPDSYGSDDSSAALSGGFAGAHIGLNRQTGVVVTGAEADFAFSRLRQSSTIPGVPHGDPRVDTSADVDWFATLRGRLGVADGAILVYGTAGLALGHGHGEITVTPSGGTVPPGFTASDDALQLGIAAGAGLEVALDAHWAVRAEYLHLELPAVRYDFAFDTVDSSTATSTEAVSENLFRAGVSYRF